jgi:hypothetical protein
LPRARCTELADSARSGRAIATLLRGIAGPRWRARWRGPDRGESHEQNPQTPREGKQQTHDEPSRPTLMRHAFLLCRENQPEADGSSTKERGVFQIQPPPVTRRSRRGMGPGGACASFESHAACNAGRASSTPRDHAGGSPSQRRGNRAHHEGADPRCRQPSRFAPAAGRHRQRQHEPREHDDSSTENTPTPGEHPRSLATAFRKATPPPQLGTSSLDPTPDRVITAARVRLRAQPSP